jgi:hypothetical protein
VKLFDLGQIFEAKIVAPCFLDPDGRRLHD